MPEPSLGGDGYGDLLVYGTVGAIRVALLIEDKITAGPAHRQAERYQAHATRMRAEGWDQVWCILVAPAAYLAERKAYDADIDMEVVAELLNSPEPVRLAYRLGIIRRALEKKSSSGVQIPDPSMKTLKSEYLR